MKENNRDGEGTKNPPTHRSLPNHLTPPPPPPPPGCAIAVVCFVTRPLNRGEARAVFTVMLSLYRYIVIEKVMLLAALN